MNRARQLQFAAQPRPPYQQPAIASGMKPVLAPAPVYQQQAPILSPPPVVRVQPLPQRLVPVQLPPRQSFLYPAQPYEPRPYAQPARRRPRRRPGVGASKLPAPLVLHEPKGELIPIDDDVSIDDAIGNELEAQVLAADSAEFRDDAIRDNPIEPTSQDERSADAEAPKEEPATVDAEEGLNERSSGESETENNFDENNPKQQQQPADADEEKAVTTTDETQQQEEPTASVPKLSSGRIRIRKKTKIVPVTTSIKETTS